MQILEVLKCCLVETKCGSTGSTKAAEAELTLASITWANTCMCPADQPGDGKDWFLVIK